MRAALLKGNKVVIHSLQRPGLSCPPIDRSKIGLLSCIQPTRLQTSLGWVASRCIWRLPGPSPLVTGRSTAAHSPGIASYIHITSLPALPAGRHVAPHLASLCEGSNPSKIPLRPQPGVFLLTNSIFYPHLRPVYPLIVLHPSLLPACFLNNSSCPSVPSLYQASPCSLVPRKNLHDGLGAHAMDSLGALGAALGHLHPGRTQRMAALLYLLPAYWAGAVHGHSADTSMLSPRAGCRRFSTYLPSRLETNLKWS